VAWHDAYDEAGSPLQRRLVAVQQLILDALADMHPGPIRVVSMCAGQGRDVIGALADHPRRADVTGRLVEIDERNAAIARDLTASAGLDLEVTSDDAGVSDAYKGAVPADLVLVCGVFGNVVDDDIAFTIEQLPQLCAEHATVLWTRGREPNDLTPKIRQWFAAAGFGEVALIAPGDATFVVGANRLLGTPGRFRRRVRFFEFLDEQHPGSDRTYNKFRGTTSR
jgi:hypothetical protein